MPAAATSTPPQSLPLKPILKSTDRPVEPQMGIRSQHSVHWATVIAVIAVDADSKTGSPYHCKLKESSSQSLKRKITYPSIPSLSLPPPTKTANTSARMTSHSNPKSHTSKVPPRVPEAPRSQRPPPAPRPRRLSSPDLPEIEGSRYFPNLRDERYTSGRSQMDAQRKSSLDSQTQADRRQSGGCYGVHARSETMKCVVLWETESSVRLCSLM